MKLNSMIKEETPRYKAQIKGIENISDGELLAIIIKGNNALDIAQELLATFKNLRNITNSSIPELQKIPGIGKVKALEIKACLEIARRFNQIKLRPGEMIRESGQVFSHFHEKLRDQKKEKFYCVLLDSQHCIIKEELISVGSLNLSIVHPREIFKAAIKESAESMILVHNHPSGNANPSKEDLEVTKRLVSVGKLVGIEILDHIIIGQDDYSSFLEKGLM